MTRRLVAAAACALLLAAWAWRPVSDVRAELRAAEALAAVSHCLLGADGALAANKRLRAVSIAASLDVTHGAWPQRCESYVDGLRDSLADVQARRRRACGGPCDDAEDAALVELRAEASRAADLVTGDGGDVFDADRLVSLGRALGYDAVASTSVPPAPSPVALLDPARMQPFYVGNYLRLLTDPAGDATMDLLFYEDASRYALCNVAIGRSDDARCRTLSEDIPVGLAGELLAAEDGAPRRMFAQGADGEEQALFDVSSGRRITTVAHRPMGGFVWRDGTVARLGFEPPLKDLALFRVGPRGEEPPLLLDAPAAPSVAPRLLWDEVVWALDEGGGRHRFFARHVTKGDALGPAIDLGATVALGSRPEVEVCRSDTSLALMVVGPRTREGAVLSLMFRTERGWQPPIGVRVGAGNFGFTCRETGATLSWIRSIDEQRIADALDGSAEDSAPVRGRYAVHRLRCNAAGCDQGRAVVSLTRRSLTSRYVAGDLGQAMVVLWRSPLGDVRMRVAPLEELPGADDVPVFDDLEHDGFDWDLERDPIFGRAGGVLVLLSQQVGTREDSATYGIRISPEGNVVPVGVIGGDGAVQHAEAL